jgi:CBS domain containing-hemolysin-like protein
LYDRHDLIDLLQRQLVQPDNRIEQTELDIALHALTFGDDTVAQHLTPRRVVKAVNADDSLGPILMDELHKSGHSRFPVYAGKTDNIVGTLYLRDLVHAKAGGTAKEVMKPGVAYVHEEQSLYDALQAILRTHRQLFVVVNSFEEYVGIITIEDILETILGKPIIDEFDQYDDLRAVAARSAKKEHKEHLTQKSEEKAEDSAPLLAPESPESLPEDEVQPGEGAHIDLSKPTPAHEEKEPPHSEKDDEHAASEAEAPPETKAKPVVHREEDIDATIEL